MALTGLDIYKQLPKTNCKKCGFPTCLAFAMQVATKKVGLDKCPDVSAEGRAALDGASAPPIKLITLGDAQNKVLIGNETVLFRHEQTFVHPPGVAIRLDANLPETDLTAKLQAIQALQFQRVGATLRPELVFLEDAKGNPEAMARAVERLVRDTTLLMILSSPSVQSLKAGLDEAGSRIPLLYAATSETLQAMTDLAKTGKCPLVVKGSSLDDLAQLTPQVKAAGWDELVLDPGSRGPGAYLRDLTQIRRLALKKSFRPLGYPVIAFTSQGASPQQEVAEATLLVAKYASLIVLQGMEPWQVLPVLACRQNLYTDPQKPIQVEPKVYEIGQVTENSPVLVTTNFSLTYFTVEGEVEASRVPCYIVVVPSEGMSVLTAFAADKFTPESTAKFLKQCGIEDKVRHRKLMIPGYVAVMSGALQEESGWEVMVGPREASAIPTTLKTLWKH